MKAIVFDLDGVVVSTDEYHYQGWKQLADIEGIYFDRKINHRLRGVSRMESLNILLEAAPRNYSDVEKIELAERKNRIYCQLLQNLTPDNILPGVMNILNGLKQHGIKVAIGSSSKNSSMILARIGLADFFDATVDGNDISNSKPNPEVFLKAAERLGVDPSECLVVEDAVSGVEAARAAGMKCLAVSDAAGHPDASLSSESLASVTVGQILKG